MFITLEPQNANALRPNTSFVRLTDNARPALWPRAARAWGRVNRERSVVGVPEYQIFVVQAARTAATRRGHVGQPVFCKPGTVCHVRAAMRAAR